MSQKKLLIIWEHIKEVTEKMNKEFNRNDYFPTAWEKGRLSVRSTADLTTSSFQNGKKNFHIKRVLFIPTPPEVACLLPAQTNWAKGKPSPWPILTFG